MFSFDLRDKDFIGFAVVNAALDLVYKNSRYLIHIPELLPFVSPSEGIWCYNGLNRLQIVDVLLAGQSSPLPTYENTVYGSVIHRDETLDPLAGTLKQGMTGSYSPLLPSVKYFIKFIENDINSGIVTAPLPYDIESEVEKVISDDTMSSYFSGFITGGGDNLNILEPPSMLFSSESSRASFNKGVNRTKFKLNSPINLKKRKNQKIKFRFI